MAAPYGKIFRTSHLAPMSHITTLLLLAASTWSWGRSGRHDFPPAGSVIGCALHLLLFHSSRVCRHSPSISALLFLVLFSHAMSPPVFVFRHSLASSLDMSTPPQSSFPAPLCCILYFLYYPNATIPHNCGVLGCEHSAHDYNYTS